VRLESRPLEVSCGRMTGNPESNAQVLVNAVSTAQVDLGAANLTGKPTNRDLGRTQSTNNQWGLLVPQRNHRIDAHCPTGGDIAGCDGDAEQHQRNRPEGHWIVAAHAIQQVREAAKKTGEN
jgi:hypothetical protein